ncbi:MAG: MBL fold metallo-hydrolase [Truepera sp.]|nr:MBL fold metallo-hydrolase [Truepera sp.]
MTVPLGPLKANGYLLIEGGDVVVVDPGGEGEDLAAALKERGWTLKAVWLTHAHFDHVGGVAGLLRAAGSVPVHMHPADEQLLRHAAQSAARWNIEIEAPPTDFVALGHGETLVSGAVSARVLHTPGHAPGHVAFYLEDAATVLSGDALFKGSIGRTDLPYGDHEQLLESIRRELLSLPAETRVLPGHGEPTTVAAESASNPFL